MDILVVSSFCILGNRKYVAVIILFIYFLIFLVHLRTHWCWLVCFCLVEESKCQQRVFGCALVSTRGASEFPPGLAPKRLSSRLPAREPVNQSLTGSVFLDCTLCALPCTRCWGHSYEQDFPGSLRQSPWLLFTMAFLASGTVPAM